jgi:hypothetical protein
MLMAIRKAKQKKDLKENKWESDDGTQAELKSAKLMANKMVQDTD